VIPLKNRLNKVLGKAKISILGGFFAGVLNSALGAGGGMILVPILKKSGIDPRHAHATSISITFPISVLSASMYLIEGRVEFMSALSYIIYGMIGSLLGTFVLLRINTVLLRRILGVFIIIGGTRLLFK
jgi:uncharacterized membrane protein YfcA